MQSLMGDRFLKWFLNRSRRQFRGTGSAWVGRELESDGTSSSVAAGNACEQAQARHPRHDFGDGAENLDASLSTRGPYCSPDATQASNSELNADNERQLEDAAAGSSDATEGGES